MKIKYCGVLLVVFLAFGFLRAGEIPSSDTGVETNQGSITGRILDNSTDEPVEDANVILHTLADSTQITGTVTNPNGRFRLTGLRPGEYILEIRFIGYNTQVNSDIRLTSEAMAVDLGDIMLEQGVLQSEAVIVEEEKPAIEYRIDRKVINVDQFRTATSGFAVDILENVPSVAVDIEGTVTLRGSSNFTLHIDGRPTVLDPQEALQQIPASSIAYIEVITNPSAKYNPEGSTGIINIVMKEGGLTGSSGMVQVNGGLNDKYGGNGIYTYKQEKYTVNLGANYNHRTFGGTRQQERQTSLQQQTTYFESSGESSRGRDGAGFHGGLEYHISDNDMITLGARYGEHQFRQSSDLNFTRWNTSDPEVNHYIDASESLNNRLFSAANMSYLHQFDRSGHELSMDAFVSRNEGNGESTSELLNTLGEVTSGKRSGESGPSQQARLQIDYSLPLRNGRQFEAGYEGRMNESEDQSEQYEFDPEQQAYLFQPQFSYTTLSDRSTQSIYSLYSGQLNNIGYQAGLRGEYTYRNIAPPDSGSYFHIDRWDYFPSIHLSYGFSGNRQVMVSYTRRINRPRDRELAPFQTWTDAYNLQSGNPSLLPEYIDSYDLGYQTRLGESLLNIEAYYRVTHNRIERIQSLYNETVTLHTVDNVGADYALGSEVSLRWNPLERWNINFMGNLYDYRIEGVLNEQSFSRESFSWSVRLNNTISLGRSLQVEFNGSYRSPTVSSQGHRDGFFVSDLAVRKQFLNNKLAATLQIRDLFGTMDQTSTSEGPGFRTWESSTREAPVVMLGLRWNLSNFSGGAETGRGRGHGPGGFPI